MLTLLGKRQTYCDGVSRRNFFKIGALGFGSLTLPRLRCRSCCGPKPSRRPAGPITGRSSTSIWRAVRRTSTPSISSPTPRRRFAASSIRSRRPCRAWKSAISCRSWPRSPRSSASSVRSPASATSMPLDQTESGWSENDLRTVGGHPSLGLRRGEAARSDSRRRADVRRSHGPYAAWLLGAGLFGIPAGRRRAKQPSPARRNHARAVPQRGPNCSRSSTTSAATWIPAMRWTRWTLSTSGRMA